MKQKISYFLLRITSYEFWPFWLFYLPAYFYGILLMIKYKSWNYFMMTNPTMKNAGAFGADKTSLLDKLPEKYLPKHIIIPKTDGIKQMAEKFSASKLAFPIVAKPNIGERGINVEKINSTVDLKNYFLKKKHSHKIILQEFITYPIELGVLFYRYPSRNKKSITSLTVKKFLKITGNGKDTFLELIRRKRRENRRIKNFTQKYKTKLNQVIPCGKTILLEPIGNHNRGTVFLNANFLINKKLINVFASIAKNIEGFYYGRFDIKVKSIDDLFRGKNIKIMEINGVNSEPAHIYDSSYKLWQAYKDIFFHMKLIGKISYENRQKNSTPKNIISFIKEMLLHLKNR